MLYSKRLKVCEGPAGNADSEKENCSRLQRRTDGPRTPFASIANVTGITVKMTVNCYVDPEKEKVIKKLIEK